MTIKIRNRRCTNENINECGIRRCDVICMINMETSSVGSFFLRTRQTNVFIRSLSWCIRHACKIPRSWHFRNRELQPYNWISLGGLHSGLASPFTASAKSLFDRAHRYNRTRPYWVSHVLACWIQALPGTHDSFPESAVDVYDNNYLELVVSTRRWVHLGRRGLHRPT